MKEEKTNGELSQEQINTLVQAGIIPTGTPQAMIKVFADLCKSYNLSPAKKEISLVSYNTKEKDNQGKEIWVKKYTAIVGRDGLRIKAQRTGELVGIDNPQFDLLSNGEYKTPSMYNKGELVKVAATKDKAAYEFYKDKELPTSCTTTIYRMRNGVKCAFTATVLFEEFNGKKQKWLTMPFHMIAKVAECHALKMGFGEELQGLYVEEEMAAFEDLKQDPIINTELAEIEEEILQLHDAVELKNYFDQLIDAKLMTPEIRTIFSNRKEQIRNGKQLTA